MRHEPEVIAEISRRVLNGTGASPEEMAKLCEHVNELNRVVKNLRLCQVCNQPLDGFGGTYCNAPHSARRMKYVIGKLCDAIEDLSTVQSQGGTEIDTLVAMIIGRLERLATLPP